MGLLNGQSSLLSVATSIISFMNLLVYVLGSLALVIFFIGLIRYISKSADAKAHTEGRESIFWSLTALFVLFSLWGILQLLNVSFFGGSLSAPSYNVTKPATFDNVPSQ